MAFTVYSIFALLELLRWLYSLRSRNMKIQKFKQSIHEIDSQKIRRVFPAIHYKAWDLPLLNFRCIVDATVKKGVDTLCAEVLHNYNAREPDEMSLPFKGQIITDVVEVENGWCKGVLLNKSGFFPSSYVKILKNTDIS